MSVGDDSAVDTIVDAALIAVIAVRRIDPGIGALIVKTGITTIAFTVICLALLDVPVQIVVCQRRAIHPQIMAGATVLTGVQTVGSVVIT